MTRKREFGMIFLVYWTLYANFSYVFTKTRFVDTLPTFTDPDGNILSNVVIDHNSGDVFVTGRNVLYHFSSDLEMKRIVRTGPVKDSDDCPIPPYSCDKKRHPTDNDNHLLKMINFLGSTPQLLICGSVCKKLCQVRSTDKLDEVHWIYPHNDSLGYNLGSERNVALFHHGINGQWTLITAPEGDAINDSVLIVSRKELVKENDDYYFRHPLQNDSTSSRFILPWEYRQRRVLSEGFVHDEYVYFLANYWTYDGWVTRLLRFCTGDATFQSYAELPLICLHGGKDKSITFIAHYGDSPSSTDKSLYVGFWTGYEHRDGTTICVFPMTAIAEAFNKAPRDCDREIFGEMCNKEEKKDDESLCGTFGTPYIVNQPLFANSSAFVPLIHFQDITIIKQYDDIVVIGGGSDGSVIKVSLSTGEVIAKNSMLDKHEQFSVDVFFKNFVFDRKGEHIYLLFRKKIIKYPVSSCGVHETCSICLMRSLNDPLTCGWCEDRCTTQAECPHPGSFNRETCEKPRLYGIHPNKGPTSGGTQITLFGKNLEYGIEKERIFFVNKRVCKITGFDGDKASCITGNLTFFREDFPESIALRVKDVTYAIDGNYPSDLNVTRFSQSFEYTPDPVINQMQPGFTSITGLMNVTATGLQLDSVQHPKLVVKVSIPQRTKDLELLEDCWSDPEFKGTVMTCRSPPLPKRNRVPIPTSTQPLLTHVAFIMDGVQTLRNFNIHQEELSRLLYYPDPVFKEVRKIGDNTLEIKGNHLYLINIAGFQIRLGDDYSCKIVAFSVEYLTCDIPSTFLSNLTVQGTNISVQVYIGYSRHQIGYIMIGKPDNDPFDPPKIENLTNTSPIWWIICVLILVFVIFIAFRCFKSCKKKYVYPIDKANQIYRSEVTNGDLPVGNEERSAAAVQGYASAALGQSSGSIEMRAIMKLLEDNSHVIPKSCLVVGEKVGAGQFGCVYEGILQRPEDLENVKVAIKTLREHSWSNPQTVESFLKEALIMKDFDHPNVLSLLGVCFEGSGPSIVLPFMENRDLCSYIRDETKVLPVNNLLKFAIDIASGMSYLENKKFIHRDLAARNCILNSSMDVKVADFGLSRDVYVDDYYFCENRNVKLPYRWMALESLEKQVYSTKTDVWSYGVLLWELMTRGSIPYAHVGNWDVLEYMKLGHRLDQPEHCPKSVYRVMLACWNKESKMRPSFLLLHDWISHKRQRLLDRKQIEAPFKSVPAQHTAYYSSREHYLGMDGHDLSEEILKESCILENEYLDMNKDSAV